MINDNSMGVRNAISRIATQDSLHTRQLKVFHKDVTWTLRITVRAKAKDAAGHNSTQLLPGKQRAASLSAPTAHPLCVFHSVVCSLSHCTQNAIFVRSHSLAKLEKK